MARSRKSAPERFWPKVHFVAGGCWIWTASLSRGYGIFWTGERNIVAHRWAYIDQIGPVPEGYDLDHLCRNRACVNPAHLEPVTRLENLRRSELVLTTQNAAKTECPSGHPYDEENTHYAQGRRYCRACDRARSRK